MQFAGVRTDEDFNEVGEPHNFYVKLADDVLPEPDAIMVTGITPQKTRENGITEAELFDLLDREVFTPNTCMMGFNSIRFDDEFMRYGLYRSFYDPYEREWQDGRHRWDIMDVARMTRALRPDGINWPTTSDGKATNRLEKLSVANNIEHGDAHDALSDVRATIGLTKLIKEKQPKLFDHLYKMSNKREVAKLVNVDNPQPLVHTSSKLSSEYAKTSVVIPIAKHPRNPNAVLVYDLRYNPTEFAKLSPDELKERAFTPYRELLDKDLARLPVKAIHLNKSPAIAPLGVLDEASQDRIKLKIEKVEANLKKLRGLSGFAGRVAGVYEHDDFEPQTDVDFMLYDGFFSDSDRNQIRTIRTAKAEELADSTVEFQDNRLPDLLLRYKARNYPHTLTGEERNLWEQFRKTRLTSGEGPMTFIRFANRLNTLAKETVDKDKEFLLQELQLWAESITPFENESLDLEN